MFLFFHTNAAGMPKSYTRPASDTYYYPRMVQVAWQQYDKFGKLLVAEDFIIQPDGFDIPADSERFHKISTERAREEGVLLEEVLPKFSKLIDESEYVIAHNMNLAANIVGAEFVRKEMSHRLFSCERFSLMQEATYFCKIKGRGGKYKWPSLQEIHAKIFQSRFEDGHDAKIAVQATANCFFALVKKEEIDLF